MPKKKSEKMSNESAQNKKGKKGGQAQRSNGQQKNNPDTLDYLEIDEFTLDDIPGSSDK